MDFNYMQLIPTVMLFLMVWLIYKKNYKFSAFIFILMMLSLTVMPVKLTQSNMSRFENSNKFDNIEERVVVEKQSFEDYQKLNYDELKKESKNEKF